MSSSTRSDADATGIGGTEPEEESGRPEGAVTVDASSDEETTVPDSLESSDLGAALATQQEEAVAVPVAVPGPHPTPADAETQSGAGDGAAAARSRPLQSIVDLLHDLAIAVVVCVVLITYVVQAFKVQGTSMSPELRDGERILVNKFLYRIADIGRGDVVVFWYPEDPELSFIKRVVGLPGETVEIVNGTVYVEGRRLDEEYVGAENADRRSYPRQEIRPGHYFVLGDNRRGSNDSRSWGLVPERYIYGKAFLRIWPLGDLGLVE